MYGIPTYIWLICMAHVHTWILWVRIPSWINQGCHGKRMSAQVWDAGSKVWRIIPGLVRGLGAPPFCFFAAVYIAHLEGVPGCPILRLLNHLLTGMILQVWVEWSSGSQMTDAQLDRGDRWPIPICHRKGTRRIIFRNSLGLREYPAGSMNMKYFP